MARRLLAIVTDDPLGLESLREIRPNGADDRGGGIDLRVIVPAVEANAFRHTLGDVDEPKQEAEARLGRVLAELRANGIEAAGEVGDPDPIQAAQDALLKAPTDEIVIFEHDREQARWFEDGLLARAETGLDPPFRLGEVTGRAAVAILIAIGIALVNLAHVVGLTLMESVRYRGGFAKLFRYLSLIGTPIAVVVNLVLLVS
jgi:hypothetical protein